jgi:predicted DNA-binding transcriptional regulator AlpA
LKLLQIEKDARKHLLEDDPLLRTRDAATILGLEPHTLDTWRHQGKTDPPYVRLGRRTIRYKYSDLKKYIEENYHANGEPTEDGQNVVDGSSGTTE